LINIYSFEIYKPHVKVYGDEKIMADIFQEIFHFEEKNDPRLKRE